MKSTLKTQRLGRPRKTSLSVRLDTTRDRWLVIVPASWTGKNQVRRWFKTPIEASLWADEVEIYHARGLLKNGVNTPLTEKS